MARSTIYPKVAVLCTNSAGSPELHTCTPEVTHEQMLDGMHYDLAKENAEDAGYAGPMIAFDATDSAARQLADVSAWFGGDSNELRARETTPADPSSEGTMELPNEVEASIRKLVEPGPDGAGASPASATMNRAGRSQTHGNVQAVIAATEHLFDGWRSTIAAGAEGDLIHDVDLLLDALGEVRRHALGLLPVKNGGLGGRPKQLWLDELSAIDVGVCPAEGAPADGFWQIVGGWRVDDLYASEEEAISAAVRLNLDRASWDAEAGAKPASDAPRAR